MNDLIERLENSGHYNYADRKALAEEAAQELRRLTEQNERLRSRGIEDMHNRIEKLERARDASIPVLESFSQGGKTCSVTNLRELRLALAEVDDD